MKEIAKLRQMTADDYAAWRAATIPEYAEEKTVSGAWSRDEALQRATESLDSLLPAGLETPGHFLFTLRRTTDDALLGYLWFGRHERDAYLYDISILPEHRRQGHGRTLMRLLEQAVRERGFNSIALHVFGHNAAARDLYQSEGYVVTDLTMRKVLAPAHRC